MRAPTLVPLPCLLALAVGCSPSGPPNCHALEACCDQLQAEVAHTCRQGVEAARGSQANESDIDAVCSGALDTYRASGACTVEDTSEEPSGGLRLQVLGAGYLPGAVFEVERASLFVLVSLQNTADGASASLNPVLFTLRLDGGVGVVGQLAVDVSNACAPDLSVLAAGSASCVLKFAIPSGASPSAVVYGGLDGRGASASIPRCGPDAPETGLCPEGQLCEVGHCQVTKPDPIDPSPDLSTEGCFDPYALSSSCLGCFVQSDCLSLSTACPEACQRCSDEPTSELRCECQGVECGGCVEPVLLCLDDHCPGCR